MPKAYYNEVDSYAAGWLRNLAAGGLICPGDVDQRDIRDVTANDIKGYTQHHFFAGIGIWSVALRMAGWPDNRGVTTGSCPCQPFSGAGKGDGFDDERHLWPAWHWLIQQYRPDTIFGEQVAGKDTGPWVDLVSSDLESLSYAFASVVLPVAGLGAPDIRHRTFWVADTEHAQRRALHVDREDGRVRTNGRRAQAHGIAGTCGEVRGLADTESRGRGEHRLFSQTNGSGQDAGQSALCDEAAGWLGNTERAGLPNAGASLLRGAGRRQEGGEPESSGGPCDPWRELEWIACLDGKLRPTQPGLFPLAPRHPGDVGKLRAYGNAISPQIAAEVIRSYMEVPL